MESKKSESTKPINSVIVAGLIAMSIIAVSASIIMTIQSASASAVDDQKRQDCLPRSDPNNHGKDNAGNEHDESNPRNPHDEGFPKGNPHDRCIGS